MKEHGKHTSKNWQARLLEAYDHKLEGKPARPHVPISVEEMDRQVEEKDVRGRGHEENENVYKSGVKMMVMGLTMGEKEGEVKQKTDEGVCGLHSLMGGKNAKKTEQDSKCQ